MVMKLNPGNSSFYTPKMGAGSKEEDNMIPKKLPHFSLAFGLGFRVLHRFWETEKLPQTMIAIRAAASAALRSSSARSSCEVPRLFSIASFMPPPTPAADQVPKAEPNTNLFISGLNKRTTSEKLHEAFSQFGEVVSARVVTDRVSGYSKGFGFVKYATLEDAAKGIEGMDGKYLEGWVIFAEYARPRPPAPGFNQPSPYNQGSPYGRQ